MDNAWQTKWEGRWDQFKGKVKQTWGDMPDDDCDVAEGKYERWSVGSRLAPVSRRKRFAIG